MKKLISIVLPVYNGAKFLTESIDSIIAQTYTNWELIIVDDCSTDETRDIALKYTTLDNRIKYYRNENNLKLPANLNKGFSFTKGDFLTWTSDDNRFLPHALETMLNSFVHNNEIDFVFASNYIIDTFGKRIESFVVPKTPCNIIVGSNCVGACFLYTRRVYTAIGEYDPDCILVEDFDYWQRIFASFRVHAIHEYLYEYRIHDSNLTSTMKKDIFYNNLEKVILKNQKLFGKLNLKQKYNLYNALNKCRVQLRTYDNPYRFKYYCFCFLNFLFYRIPDKIKRVLNFKD